LEKAQTTLFQKRKRVRRNAISAKWGWYVDEVVLSTHEAEWEFSDSDYCSWRGIIQMCQGTWGWRYN